MRTGLRRFIGLQALVDPLIFQNVARQEVLNILVTHLIALGWAEKEAKLRAIVIYAWRTKILTNK